MVIVWKGKNGEKIYSPNFIECLKKVVHYDKRTFYEMSTVELKTSLET